MKTKQDLSPLSRGTSRAGVSENFEKQMEKEINKEDSTPENIERRPDNIVKLGDTKSSNMTNMTMKPEKQPKLDYDQMKGKSRLKGDSEHNVTSDKLSKELTPGPPSARLSLLPEHDKFSPSLDLDRESVMSS